MLDCRGIERALHQSGIAGKPVCLHSSQRSFGPLEGGPDAVIDGFLAAGCTLLVPTFSDEFFIPPPPALRPVRNGWNYGRRYSFEEAGVGRVFQVGSALITREEMGIIPATVLTRPGKVRGQHPLGSFTALGPLASGLIMQQSPTNSYAPLYQLARSGGVVVLAGVDLTRMTLLHAAEEQAGRQPFVRWANGPDGQPLAVAMGGCSEGFNQLEGSLSSLLDSRPVGQSNWLIYPAQETLEVASEAIRKNPRITRCQELECDRCEDQIAGGPEWDWGRRPG